VEKIRGAPIGRGLGQTNFKVMLKAKEAPRVKNSNLLSLPLCPQLIFYKGRTNWKK